MLSGFPSLIWIPGLLFISGSGVIVDVMVISPDLPRTDFTIVIPAGPRRTSMKVGPDFAPPCTYRPLVGMASRHETIQHLEVSPKNIACADDPNTDGFSTWISLLVHERLLA